MNNKTVVILGAGPAGLSSAYELIKQGVRPIVFEKADKVGGISRRMAPQAPQKVEQILPQNVGNIPRQIEGINQVEILIIDDGSTDRTVEVAKVIGMDHIVKNIFIRSNTKKFWLSPPPLLNLLTLFKLL